MRHRCCKVFRVDVYKRQAIMRVMKNIKDLDIDIDVYAVAAVQEEVGCRGGKTCLLYTSIQMRDSRFIY